MSAAASPLGRGLYFIDVLACLLFCLTLALVTARFGRETTVPVDLPDLPGAPESAGADLPGAVVTLRQGAAGVEIFLDGEPVAPADLAARLREAPPASLTVRSEASPLARVIGAAHAAGVHDIRLAYDEVAAEGTACCE